MHVSGQDTTSPAPAPIVCGALGRYDRSRVEQMASLLGADCREAHSDDDSILLLDREPLRWQGRRQRGLGWIEAELWRDDGRCDSWEAAARAGACGLDSRLIGAALAAGDAGQTIALTVGDDEGDTFEEDLAAPVAGLLDLPHERLGAELDAYRDDWEERARRVEHQFVDHAWLVPLACRIEGTVAVTDDFALDTFMQTGVRFHTSEVVSPPTPREGSHALFDSSRRYGHSQHAVALQFHEPLIERSRAQFMRVVEPLEGHHAQPTVSLYATRTVRGISTYPSGLLGRKAPIVAPGVNDAVARALLAVPASEKTGRRLQRLILARFSARIAAMASTADTPRNPPHLPRRWRSQVAAEMHLDLLGEGPLAPFISPDLLAWLRDPARGELSPDLRLGMESVACCTPGGADTATGCGRSTPTTCSAETAAYPSRENRVLSQRNGRVRRQLSVRSKISTISSAR